MEGEEEEEAEDEEKDKIEAPIAMGSETIVLKNNENLRPNTLVLPQQFCERNQLKNGEIVLVKCLHLSSIYKLDFSEY